MCWCHHKSLQITNPNQLEGDLFSYKLDYEITGQWDGNIGKQSWNSNKQNRNYVFIYDASSRLKSANYTGIGTENYSLPNINYDKNGNITALQRNGMLAPNSFGLMDNLTYNYTGNRLNNITDAVSGNHEVDFVPNGTNAYTYWPNGAMKSDANEKITNINYNTYLNQPELLTLSDGRWIKYNYDGSGATIKTEYSTGETWTFSGGAVYKNDTLFQISDDEGRLINSNGVLEEEFDYKDHLGNSRVSFKAQNSSLVQTASTDFDPWGVILKSSMSNYVSNRFEMQGKERELTFGLNRVNFGARTYNPTIGRLDKSDPMASSREWLSSYNYVQNNPILRIDKNGALDETCCGDNSEMSLVENVYWSTRDFLVSSAVTIGTSISSIFSDTKPQRVNASYENGERRLSTEIIPKDQIAKEVSVSVIGLATALPSGGNAGTGMLMAKAGTKSSAASTGASLLREGSKAEKLANKLAKYGEEGNLPTPKTAPNQFKPKGGETVHQENGAFVRKSHTEHRGKDGEYKFWPSGSKDFSRTSKTTGNRITTDRDGKIIGH